MPAAWSAAMVQLPTATRVTVVPIKLQMLPVVGMLKVTAFPEPPPAALTVYVPPTSAGLGGTEVNEIVCC